MGGKGSGGARKKAGRKKIPARLKKINVNFRLHPAIVRAIKFNDFGESQTDYITRLVCKDQNLVLSTDFSNLEKNCPECGKELVYDGFCINNFAVFGCQCGHSMHYDINTKKWSE